MEKSEQIILRRFLKKNGFKKSDTTNNKKLMEFVNLKKDMIVYTYEEVELYHGINEYKIKTLKEFIEIFEDLTK